jgi:hypothetical protein
MERLHVFVDEFGDPQLDTSKPGVSSTYIVAALCVRQRALQRVASEAEAVRKRFFQTGEMKSSAIGAKDGRRLHVIRDLSKLDAFVIAFCARKSEIKGGTGLAFKKSFIKFFANTLYSRVIRCANDLEIVIDKHGSEQFQAELKSYRENRHGHDLFSSTRFDFEDSKSNVLLQVADVFAGSLARIYDAGKLSELSGELKDLLRDRVSVTLWPSGREDSSLSTMEHISEDDESIRQYCVQRAEEYLVAASRLPDDRDDLARSIFLDALIAHHTLGESGSFLSTQILKREISAQLGEPISDHRFRSAIVAKVRDADVIISSCAKGYRIPTCVKDVREFASFSNSLIPPMVARLAKARKGIREATLGRVDILMDTSLGQLRSIAESVES